MPRRAATVETFAARLERCAWLQLGLSMLTQLDARASFPGYNCVLALWGCYCGHSRNGRALLACLAGAVQVTESACACSYYSVSCR